VTVPRRLRPAGAGIALAVLALVVAPATAKKDDFGGGSVVFARDSSLWKTDPKGKGPAIELVALPGAAADVRAIRSDPEGRVVLFDLAGVWWWARVDATAAAPVTPDQLACSDAPARLTDDARCVVCADARGDALLISLVTGRAATRKVPAAGARVIGQQGAREVIWSDPDGVWIAPLTKMADRREVVDEPPLRGFLPAPDGTRAVGIYRGEVYEKKKVKAEADVLDSFALDGKGKRRMLHRDAEVIDWSWDSTWLLLQVGAQACVTRAIGGEYKCWKGFRGASIAPDGRWALLLGAAKAKGAAEGQHGLYRGRLEGAYTEKPSLVESVVDGTGALWLP
jgi:hypothetical protein